MKIAVVGCAHGELNAIYDEIRNIEACQDTKIDLLICCGDFESIRDEKDLDNVVGPKKYRLMKDFHHYYSGEKVAPVLTIFIGGNHEASNYLWELPYGGWVAEKIYYMGFAGVLNVSGLRVGGISGIFNKKHYTKPHFEKPPLSKDDKYSFYGIRKIDVDRLKLLEGDPPDVFLSHDWPTNICKYGDKDALIRKNPPFRQELQSNTLTGNDGAEELLHHLKPKYWFSGHMHVNFSAIVEHTASGKQTEFLALDKCLPRRQFIETIDIGETQGEPVLRYDPFWLGILKATHLITESRNMISPSREIVSDIREDDSSLDIIPFAKSVGDVNIQTTVFCERFGLRNPNK